jgi:hypothetical protein
MAIKTDKCELIDTGTDKRFIKRDKEQSLRSPLTSADPNLAV